MKVSVCITGGSRGIGLAAAQCLARAGLDVIVVARSRREGVEASWSGVHQWTGDLGCVAEIERITRRLIELQRPICLVNNAALVAFEQDGTDSVKRALVLTACTPTLLTERLYRVGLLHCVVDVLAGQRLRSSCEGLPVNSTGLTGYFQCKEVMRLSQLHLHHTLRIDASQFIPPGTRTTLQSTLTEPFLSRLPNKVSAAVRGINNWFLQTPEVVGARLAAQCLSHLEGDSTFVPRASASQLQIAAAAYRWVQQEFVNASRDGLVQNELSKGP